MRSRSASTAATSTGRGVAVPEEERRAAERPDHLVGVEHRERHDAQRGVADELRRDAAHPEQDERAEERIVRHADDQLDAGRRHRLHERVAHAILERVAHRRRTRVAARCRLSRSSRTPPTSRLVDECRGARLEHDGVAQLRRRGHRVVGEWRRGAYAITGTP